MANYKIYHNNFIRSAGQGVTDQYGNFKIGTGDAWLWNTSGFDVASDISARSFKYTANTPVPNQNLHSNLSNANVDDLADGGLLRFLNTKRSYQIQNFQHGSTEVFVENAPNTNDENESWEIYAHTVFFNYTTDWALSLDENNATNLYDNFLHTKCQGSDSSPGVSMYVCAPNMVNDGSFGEIDGSANPAPSGDWSRVNNDWTISRLDNENGTNCARFVAGGGDDTLQQFVPFALDKGKTYRVQFFIQAKDDSGDPGNDGQDVALDANTVRVHFKTYDDPEYEETSNANAAYADDSFAPYLHGTQVASGGEFISIDFTADRDAPGMYLGIEIDDSELGGSITHVCVEMVYVWERKTIDTLLVGNHDMSQRTITVAGYNYFPELYDRGASGENFLSTAALPINAVTIETDPQSISFSTATTLPVYQITILTTPTTPFKIGQLWLCEEWTLENNIQYPFDPDQEMLDRQRSKSKGGAIIDLINHTSKKHAGTIGIKSVAEAAKWQDFWDETLTKGLPFWVKSDDDSDPIFMVGDVTDFRRPFDDNPTNRTFKFEFSEQK